LGDIEPNLAGLDEGLAHCAAGDSYPRILHVNVTDHPSATWTAQQLVEACGMDECPKYLLRDRDAIYGREFSQRAKALVLM